MIPASYFFKSYDKQWWLDQFEPAECKDIVEKPRHGSTIRALFAWIAARLHRPARQTTPALDVCSAV